MKNKDEIALHDYFDNLLSPEERTEFEEILVEFIDLAIDLRKLETMQRILRNLPTAFKPNKIIIENIFDSLLEDEVEYVPSEPESKPETKKETKKEEESLEEESLEEESLEEESPEKKKPGKKKPAKKSPDKEKPAKKRPVRKKRVLLRAKTKFRLKRLFTFVIFIFFISLVGAGYYLYQKIDSTFPWKVNVISESSLPNKNLVPNFITADEHLVTYKNNFIRITIANKGFIELNGECEITIIDGTQSLSSILLKKGDLKFSPQLENTLFQLEYTDVTIKSKNSEFEINSLNKLASTVNILTNFVEIEFGDVISKIPYNHTFQILGNNHISIPLIKNSSKRLTKLVNQFDIQQNDKTLHSILNLSKRKNAYSLLFIIQKVTPINRDLIIKKLQQYFPFPDSITKVDILMLNNDALNTWWEEIYRTM